MPINNFLISSKKPLHCEYCLWNCTMDHKDVKKRLIVIHIGPHLMASIWEKDISIFAENLNSGGSFLITAVTVLYFIVSCLIQVLLKICNLPKVSHFFYSTILLKHPSCQKQYNLELDLWLSLSQCDFLSMNQDVCKVEHGVILGLLQNFLADLKRYKKSEF